MAIEANGAPGIGGKKKKKKPEMLLRLPVIAIIRRSTLLHIA